MDGLFGDGLVDVLCGGDSLEEDLRWGPRLGALVDLVEFEDGVTNGGVTLFKTVEALKCECEFGIFAQRAMVDQARSGLCYQWKT